MIEYRPGYDFNFIVQKPGLQGDEKDGFFFGEPVEFIDETVDMYDLLVRIGAFSSKTQADKQWKRSGRIIPPGFNFWENIGKLNRSLSILNLIE